MTPYITPMRGKRVRLNDLGRANAPKLAWIDGIIWGENRSRTAWRIKFPHLKELVGFHKDFAYIIEPQETTMKEFPKLTELRPGDKLKADGDFTCLSDGDIREVKQDGGELYIECSEGKHFLEGQRGKQDECVGLWRA